MRTSQVDDVFHGSIEGYRIPCQGGEHQELYLVQEA